MPGRSREEVGLAALPHQAQGSPNDQDNACRVLTAWMYCFLFLAVAATTLQHLVTLVP
jgi:hypothetical protein